MSIIGYLLGMAFVLSYFDTINWINSLIYFIGMIFFDFVTTGINNIMDYLKAKSEFFIRMAHYHYQEWRWASFFRDLCKDLEFLLFSSILTSPQKMLALNFTANWDYEITGSLTSLLVLLTTIIVHKNTKTLLSYPDKDQTFPLSIQNAIITNGALILSLFMGLLLPH